MTNEIEYENSAASMTQIFWGYNELSSILKYEHEDCKASTNGEMKLNMKMLWLW